MPVEISQEVTVEKDGVPLRGKPSKIHTLAKVTCDYSECKKGKFGTATQKKGVKVLEWEQEDPLALPPEVYQLLTLVDYEDTKKVFCGKDCMIAYLFTYKPLKAPNQQNLIEFSSRPDNGQNSPAV